jgi:hypothetical protein
VAYGVELESGKVILTWRTEMATIEIADSLSVIETLHGHEGSTKVEIFTPKVHGRFYKHLINFIHGIDSKIGDPNDKTKKN